MITRQKTFCADALEERKDFERFLRRNGFKAVSGRVPKGTKEKYIINIRRWCGYWSGWQTFKNQFVFIR